MGHLCSWGSHPEWLVRRWLARWALEDVRRLVEHQNRPPDVVVRMLSGEEPAPPAGVELAPVPGWPRSFRLEKGLPTAAALAFASCISAPSTSTTQGLTCSGSQCSASSGASATTSQASRSRLAHTPVWPSAEAARAGAWACSRPWPAAAAAASLAGTLRAAHPRRRRVDGGHRRHALRVLLLSRLQALERRQALALPPALLGLLARRLAQVPAVQHDTLAVVGRHDDRVVRNRPAGGRLTRLVEGVEVHQPPCSA